MQQAEALFYRRASREEVAEQAAERMEDEEQAEEKGEWGGAAQRETARQQLVRVKRMARQNARSMVRPLGMERRVARGVVELVSPQRGRQ